MARTTPFSVGQRWRVDRTDKPSFDFVIIGPGNQPDEKLCRLEVHMDWFRKYSGREPSEFDLTRAGHNTTSPYKHKHLKKVAVLVKNPP